MKDKDPIVFLILCTCLFATLGGRNQQFPGETKDSWISEESEGNLSEEFTQNPTVKKGNMFAPKEKCTTATEKSPGRPQEFKPGTFML